MEDPLVIVYSKPGCQQCRLTEDALDRLGVQFEERDVTADPEAFAAVGALGYTGLPVVVTPSGDHWSGLNRDKILALGAPGIA